MKLTTDIVGNKGVIKGKVWVKGEAEPAAWTVELNDPRPIAEGSPAEIKSKTSGKRIRCITSLSLASVRQIQGVTEVKEDREAVEIHAAEAELVVRELLARDSSLSGLEVTSAGLEEAFLALTSDSGQNGNHTD